MSKYKYTIGTIIVCILIIFFYARFKVTSPVKSKRMERSVVAFYHSYKLLGLVVIGMLFVIYLVYRTESRLFIHASTLQEYKDMHAYLLELSSRKDEPTYETDGVRYKKMRELQYFTDNISLRQALRFKDYGIAAEILQKKMEEKHPEILKNILCDEVSKCMVAIRGRPIVTLSNITN